MKIAADTNVLVRSVIRDDAAQARTAKELLASAEAVAVSVHALCEFTWVMRQAYRQPPEKIAAGIRLLVDSANVVSHRQTVDAGLAMLDAGGDFADGVIAHEGKALGASEFVSFDRMAVALLKRQGEAARLLK